MKDYTAIIMAALAFGAISVAGAEWHHGFETTEGYRAGESPVGDHVSVIGGVVSIETGEAADGEQFLRYVPGAGENALVLKIAEEVAEAEGRSIQFAVRLLGESQRARLVLSSGQTVGVQPVAGGVQVDISGSQTQFVASVDATNGWLEIGLHESVASGTWDLTIGGSPAAVDLPLLEEAELLRDLLIFADGALDVDAVLVTTFPSAIDGESDAGDDELSGSAVVGVTGSETGDDVGTDTEDTSEQEQILTALDQVSNRRALEDVPKREDGTVPDGALIFEAKSRVLAGDIPGAWAWLTVDAAAYESADLRWSEVLARRATIVTAFLKNQSERRAAGQFVEFALSAVTVDADGTIRSAQKGQALYWLARLAREAPGRRADALRWAQEARENDTESKEVQALAASLERAAASFPRP